MNDNGDNIKQEVLKAIESGAVKQRPHWYFVVRGVLIGTGIAIVLCLAFYLASFILFMLQQSGVWFAPSFGLRGWFSFFRSLPWLLVGFSIIFVVALEFMVRRYAFAYREPLSYSVLGIVGVVFLGSVIIFETSLHRSLFIQAERRGLPPPIASFYRDYLEQRFDDVHPGMVVATTSAGFVIQEAYDNATASVVVASGTELPQGVIAPSDTVVVFGSEASNVIQAVGIRKVGSAILWIAPASQQPPACDATVDGC